jgi:ribosomal protein S18 acetylase RimI-like enzyme
MMRLKLRPARPEDAEFVFQTLKATMREYVDQTWGWDEEWQRAYFEMRFDPAENQIVVLDDQGIGVIGVEKREDEVVLSSLYILPEYQGRGIGTRLIKDVLAQAFRDGLPVGLRVLRVNPARRLYERLGFVVVEETDTNYNMKATPT